MHADGPSVHSKLASRSRLGEALGAWTRRNCLTPRIFSPCSPPPSSCRRSSRHASRLERLRQDYARGVAQKDAPLSVALVGATGAGKSTLLNALAGQHLAREGENRPTSTTATVFAPAGVDLDALSRVGASVTRYTATPSRRLGRADLHRYAGPQQRRHHPPRGGSRRARAGRCGPRRHAPRQRRRGHPGGVPRRVRPPPRPRLPHQLRG